MSKDLTVVLDDRPGTLAEMGEALGNMGVNIEGTCGFPSEGKGHIHILVTDATAARRALESAGITVKSERDVLVMDIADRPGEFGRVCRKIANAAVNINLSYLATNTRLVLGVSDIEKAHSAVK